MGNRIALVFITFIFILRWKRVWLFYTLHELPIDMGNSSALLINILLGSFQLFLHSDQLSEGEESCSAVSVGVVEAALSTPEAVVASRTD